MEQPVLVVGTPAWSSWSLRPWLVLTEAAIPFRTEVVELRREGSSAAVAARSPSGKVPVLLVEGRPIWDSMAIAEWAAERVPTLWPADGLERAVARAVAAEMHSGFAALREHCPMDFLARQPAATLPPAVVADLARIHDVWVACRGQHHAAGPFLFGAFSIADAMYAPVCSRHVTYTLPCPPESAAYIETVMAMPAMRQWAQLAAERPPTLGG